MFLKILERKNDGFCKWIMLEIKSVSWIQEAISNMPTYLSKCDKQHNRRVQLGDMNYVSDQQIDGDCYRLITQNLHENNTSVIWTQEFYIMNGNGQTVDSYSL